MEYKIVSCQNAFFVNRAIAKLTQAVMEAISLGWEPLGGVVISEHGTVAQAMIKRR
jgi:hypothetical protein